MKQIRNAIFETNSSSTHSVTILTDKEYRDYEAGELVIDKYGNLYTKEEFQKDLDKYLKDREEKWWNKYRDTYVSKEAFLDAMRLDYMDDFDTNNWWIGHKEREINGEKVHAISIEDNEC